MRTMGIMVLAGCWLGGCGPQTYPVAYPEAARAVAELYPGGGSDLAGKCPAYDRELGIGKFDISAVGKEVSPGQEFSVQIEKTWEYSSARFTTISVQKADQGVMITVRSEKQLIPGKDVRVRDGLYEWIRQYEIRKAMKALSNPAP